MGANDAARNVKDDKRKKAETARRRREHSGNSGNVADWSGCNGVLLATAVAAVARDGGALRLGYTRDGGAYAVGFYGDGDPFTEYIPPSDDIDEFLKGVIEDYER